MTMTTDFVKRVRHTIRTEVKTVTPELAKKWLERNRNYRQISKTRVAQLVNSIKESGWVDDGSPIRFNSRGELVDGQHRLYIITLLGITVELVVVYGIDDDTTIDTGKIRNLADALRYQGGANHALTAALLRLVWYYEHGKIESAYITTTLRPQSRDLLLLNERYRDAVAESIKVTHGRTPRGMSPSHLSFVHFVAGQHGLGETALDFIQRVSSGLELSNVDAIWHLRRRAEKQIRTTNSEGSRDQTTRLALVIKTWNFFLLDKPCTRLFWRGHESFGSMREAFPVILTQRTVAGALAAE